MTVETKSEFAIEKDLKELAKPLIVAGIPAFNEELTIAKVVVSAQRHVDIVVVCDDGSKDSTAEIAERLGAIVVKHEQNMGYGAALQSLFSHAKKLNADILVTLDSDGQHDPNEIPLLVKPIEEGTADVVLGSRFKEHNGTADMPAYRQFGIKVITKLSNGSAKSAVTDAQSGFRAYNKVTIESVGSFCEEGMGASVELLRSITKRGLSVCEVPITCKYGNSIGVKTSTENPLTHGLGLIWSIARLVIEERPMTFLGIPGIISAVVGVLFGAWMLGLYAAESRIVTNIALASVGFLLLGCFTLSTAITLYAMGRITQKSIRKRTNIIDP